MIKEYLHWIDIQNQQTLGPTTHGPSKSHETLVGRQFEARAAAYLSRAVHAQGPTSRR
jgi:hypothetical protein